MMTMMVGNYEDAMEDDDEIAILKDIVGLCGQNDDDDDDNNDDMVEEEPSSMLLVVAIRIGRSRTRAVGLVVAAQHSRFFSR